MALLSALVLVGYACGGEQFSGNGDAAGGNGGTSGGNTGGVSGTGGGGTGGASGTGGGGTGGVSGTGGGGTGGGAGTGGSVDDAGADGSVDTDADAAPPPIAIVHASPTTLSMAPAELTSTITMPALPSAGNAIIVGISCISDHGGVEGDGGGATIAGDCLVPNGAVTDNQGNTYHQVVQGAAITSSHQAARGYIFIAPAIGAPSGPFTIQVDPEGSSAGQAIACGALEVSGLSAPPSVDATGYTAAAATTSTTAATFQPTMQPNELAVAVLTVRRNEVYAGIVPSSEWTSHHLHQDSVTGPPAHSMVSLVLTGTGAASHTWSHAQPSRGAAGIIATFRGASQN